MSRATSNTPRTVRPSAGAGIAAPRLWRPAALAALLLVSGCKDLMPSYIGGDAGLAARHASQTQAPVR